MIKIKQNRYEYFILFLCFLISSVLVSSVHTDLQAQVNLLKQFIEKGINPDQYSLFGAPLMYVLIYLAGCGGRTLQWLKVGMSVVLGIALFSKYVITREYFKRELAGSVASMGEGKYWAFLCLFVFAWPTASLVNLVVGIITEYRSSIYLGTFTPTIWHNATVIFLMPFAILLFWFSFLYIETGQKKFIVLQSILAVSNPLAKPAYFLVYALAYPMMVLANKRIRFNVLSYIPVICGGLVLLIQRKLIFGSGYFGDIGVEFFNGIVGLRTGGIFSVPIMIFLSLPFPVLYFIQNYKRCNRSLVINSDLVVKPFSFFQNGLILND